MCLPLSYTFNALRNWVVFLTFLSKKFGFSRLCYTFVTNRALIRKNPPPGCLSERGIIFTVQNRWDSFLRHRADTLHCLSRCPLLVPYTKQHQVLQFCSSQEHPDGGTGCPWKTCSQKYILFFCFVSTNFVVDVWYSYGNRHKWRVITCWERELRSFVKRAV